MEISFLMAQGQDLNPKLHFWSFTQTNDEGDGAGPYEDKSRVEGNVGQFAEVVERILL